MTLFAGESGENVMGVVGNLARPGCGYAYKVVRHMPLLHSSEEANGFPCLLMPCCLMQLIRGT